MISLAMFVVDLYYKLGLNRLDFIGLLLFKVWLVLMKATGNTGLAEQIDKSTNQNSEILNHIRPYFAAPAT